MKNFELRLWVPALKKMLYKQAGYDSFSWARDINNHKVYVDDIDPISKKENKTPCSAVISFDGSYYVNGRYFEVEVLPYIGIKDNNGNKIFEGDILKVGTYGDWGETEKHYHNYIVEYRGLPSGESVLAGFLYIPMDREIIGNIYENPELLK